MKLGKGKKAQVEELLGGILDAYDSDVIIARKEDCSVLFMNASARMRLPEDARNPLDCKQAYSRLFPDLCKNCLSAEPASPADAIIPAHAEGAESQEQANAFDVPLVFDTTNEEERIFSVTRNTIEWLDGKPANMFMLRDVDQERTAKEKLFNLAYIDHLTNVPNRQKLKEDFEAVSEDITQSKMQGMVAIFDLDNFKNINDTYGHNTGDILLQRLTGHLQGEAAFKGHLYRLGGDEFVLFYADKPNQNISEDEYRAHYAEILQGAFLSYSMPNIEKVCTISMGAAFFPSHGVTFSELLRKADIALYKAKALGRNRLIFFEDRFDKAEKFKDLYVNIQPILDARGQSFGYELIDRGTEATDDETVNLTEIDRTLDTLNLGEIESEVRYFISYTKQLLSTTALANLPKQKFIVQIHVPETCGDKDLARYRELRAYGYTLALSGLRESNVTPDLLNLAGYLKFEPAGISEASRLRIMNSNPKKVFIATNVNSAADFENAKRLGFKLFQGFFFNQQVVVKKTKEIDPLKVNYFRLLQLTSTDDYVDFQEISSVIASDVALSYKLLRLLNSAAVGLRSKISSISMAVAYLGEENLKKWIALLALRGIASDKPLEIVRYSLIRARFGELLAPHFRPKKDEKHVFLVGMLSLLHIAMEKSKEDLFAEIPVADDIKESILTRNGIYSELLAFFGNYEYSNWDEITRFADQNQLDNHLINDSYMAAVKWCDDLINA